MSDPSHAGSFDAFKAGAVSVQDIIVSVVLDPANPIADGEVRGMGDFFLVSLLSSSHSGCDLKIYNSNDRLNQTVSLLT